MRQLLNEDDLKDFLEGHLGERVLIFKHSTQCPISRAAYHQVETFESENPGVPVGMIRVIEERPLSLSFADSVNVRHASPQAVVLLDGHPVWNASHYDITAQALSDAVR